MDRRPQRSTRTDTLCPDTTLFRSTHCRLELTDHLGTHLDALNHIAFDNRFYNGVDAYSTITARGTHQLGIETVPPIVRSEEHTSELQSLMRISYAVFCLQKKIQTSPPSTTITSISPTNKRMK